MIRKQRIAARRGGFTLIELLMVLAIIVTLVGLLTAGAMKVMWRIPEVRTRTEISELASALEAFRSAHNNVPLPSALLLREDGGYAATSNPALALTTVNFLKRAWGKNIALAGVDWNGNGVIDAVDQILTGDQCLVFYLGGIPLPVAGGGPGCMGFSSSNVNPATLPRQATYYNFATNRLLPNLVLWPAFPIPPNFTGFYSYLDGWQVETSPKPYAFFSTNGIPNSYNLHLADCVTIGAVPYHDGLGWAFPNTYQIISAGKNGLFSATGIWNSTSGNPGDLLGRDDQANFSGRVLGAGSD